MAIYHLTAKAISRGAGKSVTAKAAYNARDKLQNERTGEQHDYSRKDGLLFSGIYAPTNTPNWAKNREQLWNQVEKAEKRKDATCAREYEVALPHELSLEQNRYLVQDFVKENFTRKGYVADVNIHAADDQGDNRNIHAHILVTDRQLEKDGFAKTKKERHGMGNNQAELEKIRESWAKQLNHHLERHGHKDRVDSRSLEEQGINREATQHRGVHAEAMERKGIKTERGDIGREIDARNKDRHQLNQATQETEKNIRQLERELEKSPAELKQSGDLQKAVPNTVTRGIDQSGINLEKGVNTLLTAPTKIVEKGIDILDNAFTSLFDPPKPPPTKEELTRIQNDKAEKVAARQQLARYLDDEDYRRKVLQQEQEQAEQQRQREEQTRQREREKDRDR